MCTQPKKDEQIKLTWTVRVPKILHCSFQWCFHQNLQSSNFPVLSRVLKYTQYIAQEIKIFQRYIQIQQRIVSRVRTMLTSSCNANKNRSSVESPCSRLDKNCNIQARIEQISLLNTDLKWTMLFNNQISHLASKSATLS